ncbi:MAG: DUF6252 family protein [Bacteroidota bacterium]
MKKISILVIIILTALFACKKENLVTNASMSATIDGTSWTAITRVSNHFVSTNIFTISGTSVNGEVLAITIRGSEEGTYTSATSIDSLSAQVGAIFQPSASSPSENNFFSKSGTVTISDIDTDNMLISGTFSFELTKLSETKTITTGKFSQLKYGESGSN